MEREEVKKVYESLTDNEQYGIQFGLFPVSLIGQSHDQAVALMAYRKETEAHDVNKH